MSEPTFDEIVRDEALIVSVVGEDFPLVPAGQRWVCRRGGPSDTLNVFRGRDGVMRYKRFGTDQGGTVFAYLRDYRGCHDRAEAMRVLGYGADAPAPRRRPLLRAAPRPAPPPAEWKDRAEEYLARYEEHPDRYRLWGQYRPFRRETVMAWRLGVGPLPQHRNAAGALVNPGGCGHPRLILPVILQGRITGFRGRTIPGVCDCAKWVGVKDGEARLFGADRLRLGLETIVTEAPVSVILAAQERDDVNVVAGTAGAGTWQEAWTKLVAKGRPPQVVVWYDNDLAGAPNHDTYRTLVAEWEERWRAKHPDKPMPARPQPAGPRVQRTLAEAGLYTILYQWPPGTLPHADFDAWLMERMAGAA
jgi:hypothetical protein